jgi:arylformamidase
MGDLEFEYVTGQGRPTFPSLLSAYEMESLEVAQRPDADLDLRYGSHERQRLDYFHATKPVSAVLVYFHAGYWQSRDKATFRFLATAFNDAGLDVALVNYPLCPSVTIEELVNAADQSIPFIHTHSRGLPLLLSGHSAGGHIAIELGGRSRWDDVMIKGIAAISGVFDLRPLTGTSLNERLRLDEESALAASPILRVPIGSPPAIFAVGAEETDEFRRQSQHMERAWKAAGNISRYKAVEASDHFSILRRLADPTHELHRLILSLR